MEKFSNGGQIPASGNENTYYERLLIESAELDARITKLDHFLSVGRSDNLHSTQQLLLRIQLKAMNTYSQCLHERLGVLPNPA